MKEDNKFDWEVLNNYAAHILHAKYKQVNSYKVAVDQKQLIPNQSHNLQINLTKYDKLFDGPLGI